MNRGRVFATWGALVVVTVGLAAAGLAPAADPALGRVADSGARAPANPDDANVIFHNGKVAVGDEAFRFVEAVAVRNGRVIVIGTDEEVLGHAGPDTRLVDLEGRTVLPGLYDNHVHLGVRTEDPRTVELSGVENLEDLQEALRERAREAPEGQWIVGSVPHGTGGVEPFTEDDLPTRWDLDEAASDHPVALNRGHVMLTNSRALEEAGIDASTPQPPGGQIDRNEEGVPTGVLRETPARRRITSVIPDPDPVPDAVALETLKRRLERSLAFGKTSINVPGVMTTGDMLRWLQDLYDLHGENLPRLTVQVRLSPGYDTYDDPEEGIRRSIEQLEGLEVHTGFGDDRLKLGAVKLSIDGAFSGQSAWLDEPYPGRPDYHGAVRIPEETLYPVAKRAHELGWQLGVHAIGDAAVEMVVDVMDRILQEHPRADHRHYIIHIEVKPGEETLDRMAELGIIAAMQPNLAYTIAPFLKKVLRGDELEENNPQKSLAEHGIRMSYGTDGLPDDPWVGLYAAVTRRGIDGEVYGPDERMSVEEAVRRYTMGSAYMTFDEEERGSLEPGKYADLVALNRDIFTVPHEAIKDIEPVLTVIGGRTVYARDRALRTEAP